MKIWIKRNFIWNRELDTKREMKYVNEYAKTFCILNLILLIFFCIKFSLLCVCARRVHWNSALIGGGAQTLFWEYFIWILSLSLSFKMTTTEQTAYWNSWFCSLFFLFIKIHESNCRLQSEYTELIALIR